MDLRYWVWLSLALGAGNRHAEDFLRHFANPQELYEKIQTASEVFPPLTTADFQRLRKTSLSQAEQVLEQCQRLAIDVVTPKDRDYPQRLLPIFSPPLVLYKRGNLSVLNRQVTVTIVGSRSVTQYGRTLAHQISYDLAAANVVVASGMALGGDEAAHIGALTAGGTTIAVMGCGLDIDYPKEHRVLKEQVLDKGALVSEYPPGSEPAGSHFPVRNRILSGIANGVLVVECGERSGALITANHALEQGRDVFAVPGQVMGAPAGTFGLLRDGAVPVRSAQDILEYYHLSVSQKKKARKIIEKDSAAEAVTNRDVFAVKSEAEKQKSPQDKKQENIALLTPPAAEVYAKMSPSPMGMEDLRRNTGLLAHQLFPILTELELNNLVEALPGGRYRKL